MSLRDNNNAQVLWKIMQMLQGEQVESAIADSFEELLKGISAESGAVWLRNNDTGYIYSIVSIGEANISGFSIEIGNGVVGQACESQEPISIPDASSDERFP